MAKGTGDFSRVDIVINSVSKHFNTILITNVACFFLYINENTLSYPIFDGFGTSKFLVKPLYRQILESVKFWNAF